ncbi:MAG: hypothetical protein EZS28_030198 [Streblomastix strix]|uniref:Uncharacterized protein n=1 Tax=Streblomastix strix TaxID=222440 RepID=A0A5J4UUF8_9EUKA|nr:MAG: hypothetical protein EZS28_030198 [Streblomastix strix]
MKAGVALSWANSIIIGDGKQEEMENEIDYYLKNINRYFLLLCVGAKRVRAQPGLIRMAYEQIEQEGGQEECDARYFCVKIKKNRPIKFNAQYLKYWLLQPYKYIPKGNFHYVQYVNETESDDEYFSSDTYYSSDEYNGGYYSDSD